MSSARVPVRSSAFCSDCHGKSVLQLHAREAFLSRGKQDLAVFHQGDGRILVERRESEYLHAAAPPGITDERKPSIVPATPPSTPRKNSQYASIRPRNARSSAALRTYGVCPIATDGLCSVIVNVRTPSASRARVHRLHLVQRARFRRQHDLVERARAAQDPGGLETTQQAPLRGAMQRQAGAPRKAREAKRAGHLEEPALGSEPETAAHRRLRSSARPTGR